MKLPAWLADVLRVHGDDWRRVGTLLLVSLFCAVLSIDPQKPPVEHLAAGEVAPRTVRAAHTFQYTDFLGQETRLSEARRVVRPVYVYRADLATKLQQQVHDAFFALRTAPNGTSPDDLADTFRNSLGVHVPNEVVLPLIESGVPPEAEALTVELLGRAMSDYVVADRAELPPDQGTLQVIKLDGETTDVSEATVSDRSSIRTPGEAREQVTMGLFEAHMGEAAWANAAAAVARAAVRPNLSFDPLSTREREDKAAAAVDAATVTIKRGTILFRQGDVLSESDVEEYRHLQRSANLQGPWRQLATTTLFFSLLFAAVYQFGASWLQGFSTRVRDAGAAGALLVLVALLARLAVLSGEGVAGLIGMDVQPSSVWLVVPVAGATMLMRLLVGVSPSLMFAVAASAVCGVAMELRALHVLFFIVSSLVAAGAVDHTRERMAVLRAGVFTGLVGAVAALLTHFVELYVGGGDAGLEVTIRPLWSMTFAFIGGLTSGFLVLGLVPLFEGVGFVTDYRLMELANLNHPLLRQLMLRAPGSYHHSVVVGTLAEAACEAIGANALQARVSSYFHDIGKSIKPQYFVENQRGMTNKHNDLDPTASARIIIQHVTEGGRMAREHRLPKPIIDNIYMHHGSGILQYFYSQAQAQAADPRKVKESDFRYPGPKPDTRESGVIMLADKVEAATRTIREPNEESLRAMIHQIINSVMADGQFSECPLTFQEISTTADTFVRVMLGIHHQRIEYPETAAISRGHTQTDPPVDVESPRPAVKRGSVITLEIPAPWKNKPKESTGTDGVLGEIDDITDPDTDYESVKNLPGKS